MDTIALILSPNKPTSYLGVPWAQLRFQHTAAIRAELATNGLQFFDKAQYNSIMSLHGILMVAVAVGTVIGALGNYVVPVDRAALAKAGNHVTLGVRPADMEISSTGEGMEMIVELVEELGADAYIHGIAQGVNPVKVEGEDSATAKPFLARVDGRRPPGRGEKVRLVPKAGHIHVFNAETGLRIGD